jgi:hypothetical protein
VTIPGGALSLDAGDKQTALKFREEQLQASVGTRRLTIKKASPNFTGSFDGDFTGAEIASFKKQEETGVRTAAAADETNLYLAWDVRDTTPWVNGAETPEAMYLGGDTVDFQLGTDAKSDAKRDKPVLGDLRLSIGNFKGTPTAVLYRPVSNEKAPKTFSSGVIKAYMVENVQVLAEAKIKVTKRRDNYVVEAAIPLAALGLKSGPQTLRGDFGVTYGDGAGQRTRLRNYWSNQHTGLVDDAVFELMIEPKNWGELIFP